MRGKLLRRLIFGILLICQLSICLGTEAPDINDSSKYLNAVREFADNVLKYGRDTYGPKHTPLFVDGLNVHTHEPMKWIDPDGTKWILSNLASQQNLFRTLDGLSKITGDPKYKQAAMDAIKYAFENLRTDNGLLYWGAAAAYNASTDSVHGTKHVVKGIHPYYELMWEVNPKVTRQIIESLWASHILDWSNLDLNRIGSLKELSVAKDWNQEYKGAPVFFKSKAPGARSFDTTASDLYHAAAFLFKVSGQRGPLIWGKCLAHRYIETRNPKTGISGWVYSVSGNEKRPPVDESGGWILDFYSVKGDPKIREAILGHLVLSPGVFACGKEVYIFQLMLGEMLGDDGKEFRQWALEELTAQGRAAYRQQDNMWIPIRTDGTSLERVDGKVAWTADPADFWAYALAYRLTGDQFMWHMARNIGRGNGFGDIGTNGEGTPGLQLHTDCSHPCAVLGFLELYRSTQGKQFLEMASRIGNNILVTRCHKGFFVPSRKHSYTKFDAIESLVLLNLHIAVRPEDPKAPQVWPSRVYFTGPYRQKEKSTDNKEIYALIETTESPISLDEAATMGNLELVKSLISQGTDVNEKEGYFGKTALHHAAKSGHSDIAKFLLANGAGIDLRDSSGDSPIHHAVRARREELVKLLIAKSANLNAKNNNNQTPLDIAVRQKNKEIVELLRKHGAEE